MSILVGWICNPRIALVFRKETGLVRDFAERLRSKLATARSAAVVSDNEGSGMILTLWSPLQRVQLVFYWFRDLPRRLPGKGGLDEAPWQGPMAHCSIFGINACRSLRWILSHSWARSGLSNRSLRSASSSIFVSA